MMDDLSQPDRLLTTIEVAAYLQLHPETVRAWLRAGRIPGYRLPGSKGGWRISQAALAAWAESAAPARQGAGA